MRLTLEILSGPGAGRRVPIPPGRATRVGGAAPADVILRDDGRLSDLHFALEFDGATCQLRDLGSRSGTLLNDVQVFKSAVRDGDRIEAGGTTFLVRVAPGEPAPAPEPAPPPEPEDPDEPEDLAVAAEEPDAPEDIAVAAEEPAEPDRPVMAIDNPTPFLVAPLFWEDAQGRARLTVVLKATFAIEGGLAVPAAEPMPIFTADVPYSDDPNAPARFESDLAPFKPRADVVLVGKAHAPYGRPAAQADVTLRVGGLTKTIRVFGDRKWQMSTRAALTATMTPPEPFTTMDLVYERAFGGIDAAAALYCAENLVGTGFVGKLTLASAHDKRLPNLEDPKNLIRAWNTRPRPVGFGFYGRGWAPRLALAGTYDERYRKERAPAPPEDFSHAVFNGAHPDLQVEGYLKGDEDVELVNLSPEGKMTFRLPGVRPRLTVSKWRDTPDGAAPTTSEEAVAAHLDTVVLIPEEKKLYIVFRGVCPLDRLDASAVARIRVAT